MGNQDRRQIINRLIVLLQHLLKWEFQKDSRSRSWKASIVEQRDRILQLLEESSSLSNELDGKVSYAYSKAVKRAAIETGLEESVFPLTCPYPREQFLNDDDYPE